MGAVSDRSQVIRFGLFEVDLASGEVRKAGMRLKLGGQSFLVLKTLLERPQEVVTRDELRARLWPDNTFVDYELGLKKAINRLRDVLGTRRKIRASWKRYRDMAIDSSLRSHIVKRLQQDWRARRKITQLVRRNDYRDRELPMC